MERESLSVAGKWHKIPDSSGKTRQQQQQQQQEQQQQFQADENTAAHAARPLHCWSALGILPVMLMGGSTKTLL